MAVHQSTELDRERAGIRGPSMRKLPARFNVVAMPFVLSILMSCLVSLIATLRATGFDGFALISWMQAWGLSWMVAFPALFIMLPLARKVVATVVEKP
jgi:hypothetical protein